jgi:hypothetical protein
MLGFDACPWAIDPNKRKPTKAIDRRVFSTIFLMLIIISWFNILVLPFF